MNIFVEILLGLIPPALVGLIFYIVMRSIFRADAKERSVYQKMEAEMREAREGEASKNAKSGK
ncbi:MAG: hypothetical protein RI933_4 [Actinomycetota bacterium]|jgi:Na+/H+ antiporter NhaD/arsenite permease-like protein